MYLSRLSSKNYGVTNPGGNTTSNGYPTRVPTVTPPWLGSAPTGGKVGDGVIGFGGDIGAGPTQAGGGECSTWLHLVPFGVDASSHTFSLTVLAWRATNLNVGQALWVPTPLCSAQCTLSSGLAGIVNSDIPSTNSFCTTITMTGGPIFITSGAPPVSLDWMAILGSGVGAGFISVPSLGFPFLEVIFTTGGVATSCNSLYCKG